MFEEEFPLDPDLLYLNHAAVSPWPARTGRAVAEFAQENVTRGATDYPQWLLKEQQLRGQLRSLINAPSSTDIALLKNTSEALSVVAHGLNWSVGDNIVTTDQEFPSNRIVWQSLADAGVELREANLHTDDPEGALCELIDEKTRLLTVSSVQYASGFRLDLKRLGDFCREKDILFCVDAIQSLGAAPFDVQAIGADFVMADGHKWMMGPEGLALFYCRAEIREQLNLHQFGWHMVEDHFDFNQRTWQPAKSARRFECGSPNMLAVYALSASLSLLEETGLDTIQIILFKKIQYLIDNINYNNYELLTPLAPERRLGILTVSPLKQSPERLFKYLHENAVICAQRGGGVRFSPHFYTPHSVLDRLITLLNA